jgi:hypothetical protein
MAISTHHEKLGALLDCGLLQHLCNGAMVRRDRPGFRVQATLPQDFREAHRTVLVAQRLFTRNSYNGYARGSLQEGLGVGHGASGGATSIPCNRDMVEFVDSGNSGADDSRASGSENYCFSR